MRSLLSWLRSRLRGRRARPRGGLTVVEYEAVTLIALEGRDAYRRACEQAGYCLERGSRAGCRFWSEVAIEVASRTGKPPRRRQRQRSP